jgi:hypothetical protein
VKVIACSAQLSAQDWQWMNRRARHALLIVTRATACERPPVNSERRVGPAFI